MIEAKIIADSISGYSGDRLTTVQVKCHRFILPEITRHRMFSFSVASNRAVPTKKIIEQVRDNPALPLKFGKNQKGMVADDFFKDDYQFRDLWKLAANGAAEDAQGLYEHGVHKQTVNRLLEPFQWCDMIITGTEWSNFFNLRLAQDTQPELQEVARQIKEAMYDSEPQTLYENWHLPYLTEKDENLSLKNKKLVSAARDARVSYKQHDKSDPDVDKDLNLAGQLLDDYHLSPFEHQAKPMYYHSADVPCPEGENLAGYTHLDRELRAWSGNFKGWIQQRQLIGEVNE